MSEHDVEAQILDPEWTFESSITTPSGVRVAATINVPERTAGPDVRELSEIAAMAANTVLGHIVRYPGQAARVQS